MGRRQAIISVNDDLIYWSICASHGRVDLRSISVVKSLIELNTSTRDLLERFVISNDPSEPGLKRIVKGGITKTRWTRKYGIRPSPFFDADVWS